LKFRQEPTGLAVGLVQDPDVPWLVVRFGVERPERSLRNNRGKSKEKRRMMTFMNLIATSAEVWASLEHTFTCCNSLGVRCTLRKLRCPVTEGGQ